MSIDRRFNNGVYLSNSIYMQDKKNLISTKNVFLIKLPT